MKMAVYDENEFMSAGEIPCEFCGLLWPFELYVEHVTGCRPDLTSSVSFSDYELNYNRSDPDYDTYDFENNKDVTGVSERSPSQVIDDVLASEVQKLSTTLHQSIKTVPSNQNKPLKETIEVQKNNSPNDSKQNKQDSTPPKTKGKNEPKMKFGKNDINSPKKDIFNKMKGETLLSFGNVADSSKFSDNETQDTQDEAEDIEDISNLSDVDCDETLEEFWKRARDFLNRQSVYRR